MPLIELDNNAIGILKGIVQREEYETPSDAVRHLDNTVVLQRAVMHNQDNQIMKLEDEITHLKGIMKTAGIV